MSERHAAVEKKNKSRVKAKDRALYPSMQKNYHKKKEKVNDTMVHSGWEPPTPLSALEE